MADIIDFNEHKKRSAPPPPAEDALPTEVLEHLSNLPDNALMGSLARIVNHKMLRLLLLTEIGAKVTEAIKSVGMDPDDFHVYPPSVNRYLSADITEKDPLWNGPWIDWDTEERTIRLATTIIPDPQEEGLPGSFAMDVLRLDDGADSWLRLGEGGWIDDGPPAEFFDMLELYGDDAWDDEDDDEDWDDDWDDDDDNFYRSGAEFLDLGLSIGVCQKLVSHEIKTVEQLAAMTDEQLLAIPGIGKKTLDRIRAALAEAED